VTQILPDAESPHGDELSRRLSDEQFALLCTSSQSAILGAAIAGIYVFWLLLAEHSLLAVGAWYGVLLGVSLGRAFLQHHYVSTHQSESPQRNYRIRVLLIAGLIAYGFIWSIPSTWLLSGDPAKQVLMSIFLVGLSASGLGSLTPVRGAYAAFLLPFMMPIAIEYFMVGAEYVNVAIGILLYSGAMIVAANRGTGSIEHSLRLRFENAALADRLRMEKDVVERANRSLEQQIAQREHTEAELRIAKSKAETANRAKSQFLANMSHELRTPLNAILGMSDLLLRTNPNAKQTKHALTIRNAGDRLLHLIDDILDMARIEAGALRFERIAFSPRHAIEEVVDSMADQATLKNLAVTIDITADTPAQVLGDPHRLRQILTNLLSNAIKFTSAGGVRIEVQRGLTPIAADSTAAYLRWSITDTGIGIPEQARDALFLPFSQLDESVTRKFGGSGLGLAICREIVTALGGSIGMESHPGLGSTFWFELPIAAPDTAAHPTLDLSAISTVRSHPGAKVLVVEDNATNCQLVVEMLQLSGCAVSAAANGIEALALVDSQDFDLVLMDWHMPDMDGLSATRAIRAREATGASRKHLTIVALTASVLPGDRQACERAGMDDFLAKPFSYDELMAIVQRWLPHVRAA
jgi:signal transduction histidine kinase/ActR/RegA family two-component response regulator